MSNTLVSTVTTPIPAIGVGGIAFNPRGEVLLIKRNQAPACGAWSIPGGRLEPGEHLAAACEREFFEETNLTVKVNNIIAVAERKLEGFHYVIVDFLVELIDPQHCQPIAQTDVAEARWVSFDDFSRFNLVEGLVEIITNAYAAKAQHTPFGLTKNPDLLSDYIVP